MIVRIILLVLTYCFNINNSNNAVLVTGKHPIVDSLNHIGTSVNVESIEQPNNSYYICVCAMLALVAVIYIYYKKEKQKNIESTLNDITIHISKKFYIFVMAYGFCR